MKGRIQIRQWLTKANGYPRIADVEVLHRTQKAIEVKGHGAVESPVYCFRCGRDLTHPISQQVGCGEICADHLGISWSADTSPEAIAALKARLVEMSQFQGWIPISQIEEMDFDLEAVPQYRREETKEEEAPAPESTEIVERSRIRFTVADWLKEDKGLPAKTMWVEGQARRVTEKAVLVRITKVRVDAKEAYARLAAQGLLDAEDEDDFFTDDDGRKVHDIRYEGEGSRAWEQWFPKSQIQAEQIRRAPKAKVHPTHRATATTTKVTRNGEEMTLAEYLDRQAGDEQPNAGIDTGQEMFGDLELEASQGKSDYQKMCEEALDKLGF